MIATLEVRAPLEEWRQRVGRRALHSASPLAAIGYLAAGRVAAGLIPVERLTLVVLYDEPMPRGDVALRLAGFTGRRIPWGVCWGGPGQCRFFKNLRLQPVPGGPGLRLDLAHERLLRLGLQLDRERDHAEQHPERVRDEIRLPCLWAGFLRDDAAGIVGDGPELTGYTRRVGIPAPRLLDRMRREHAGLVLYPLPWVSHRWRDAVAVYADLSRFPRRQVFRLSSLPEGLIGFQGAAAFDLFHGQTSRNRHRETPAGPLLAAG